MSTVRSESIRSFHAALRSAASLGLQLDLASNGHAKAEEEELNLVELENECLRVLEMGEPKQASEFLAQLRKQGRFSQGYLASLLGWLVKEEDPAALEPLLLGPQAKLRASTRDSLLFLYPLLWLVLAIAVLTFVCYLLTPQFLLLAEQLRHRSFVFDSMEQVREWLPVAIPIIAGATGLGAWAYMKSSWRERGLAQRYVFLRKAVGAAQLAELMEYGVEEEGAVSAGANESSGALVRWALEDQAVDTGQPAKLRFVSRIYRSVHELRVSTVSGLSPTKWSVLLGGVLVLGVACFVFLPIVDLLLLVVRTAGGQS